MRLLAVVLLLGATACSDGAVTTTGVGAPVTTSGTECPAVIAVELTETSPGVFTVATTVRSVDIPDVSYADAWEVRDLDGNVLGIRELAHPHQNEQPFTRSLSNVAIPEGVDMIEVEARDSVRGYCGEPRVAEVPRS